MKRSNDPRVISFAQAKATRQSREPATDTTDDFVYEYNLVIKVTRQDKIYALFQTYDQQVSEEDQAIHLQRILDMLHKQNPHIPF